MIFKTARRTALIAVAGVAVATLSACGAGQITQTADQVAAVDGSGANTADKTIAVRDVTVIVNEDNTAALKFTAVNTDTSMKDHSLKSVKVDGKEVQLSEKPTIERNCSVVADTQANLDTLQKNDKICIKYISSELPNDGLAAGGNKPVVFEFDSGKIELKATIAANHKEDGKDNRVEAPKSH